MAKSQPPTRRDPNEALQALESPAVRWKVILQIGAVFVAMWAVAVGLIGYVGYWGVGLMGVLTLVAAGFGLYIWRLTRKSKGIVDILKTATDAEGRKVALERLRAEDKGDAMNALAQAQLVAQERPAEAMKILEGVDLKKAPAVVQDDVRANLGLLYLMHNRAKDARALADDIRLDRQPQAKAKAMYAAVMAESFARTGKPEEAAKLLETFSADDASYGEVRPMLLRAQVFTFMAVKKRGLARGAMEKLAGVDPNMVAAFAMKASNPELTKMAKELLVSSGAIPRQKMKFIR